MRSLHIQVDASGAQRVLALAEAHGARSPVAVRTLAPAPDRPASAGEPAVVVLATIPNDSVGRFISAVTRELETATFTLMPVGALPISTPLDSVDESLRDVSSLSTMELVVASLQSIGSWRGMLAYSVLAGIVGAYGLIFDVIYLLVAAMLINPMGAPAVVSVIGIAVGDRRMAGRGGSRFLASLVTQAAAALALGLAYGLTEPTPVMEQVATLSLWSALLAIVAGAAGAQAQRTSERDSLVSGTAAGFMVAAALAPPAAVLGLSIALARWDYLALMAFLLPLQFVGICTGGWLALLLLGVRPADPSVGRGSVRWRAVLAVTVVLAVAGMTWFQSTRVPRFVKADLSSTALEIAREAVDQTDGILLIESSARFTRPALERRAGETMLFEITVAQDTTVLRSQPPRDEVRDRIERLVAARMTGVTPFVNVTVLPRPSRAGGM